MKRHPPWLKNYKKSAAYTVNNWTNYIPILLQAQYEREASLVGLKQEKEALQDHLHVAQDNLDSHQQELASKEQIISALQTSLQRASQAEQLASQQVTTLLKFNMIRCYFGCFSSQSFVQNYQLFLGLPLPNVLAYWRDLGSWYTVARRVKKESTVSRRSSPVTVHSYSSWSSSSATSAPNWSPRNKKR